MYHVFLVNNAMVELLSLTIARKLKTNNTNVIFFYVRGYTGFSEQDEYLSYRINDHKKILNTIDNLQSPFEVYAYWHSNLVNSIYMLKTCKNISYVEEGRLTHKEIVGLQFVGNRCEDVYNFKLDAKYFFHISSKAFPNIPRHIKVQIHKSDLYTIQYKERVKHKFPIIATPAARRIKLSQIPAYVKNVRRIKEISGRVYLKPHPGLINNFKKHILLCALLRYYEGANVTVLSPTISLEMEALYKNIEVFGPPSSLEEYAQIFGFKYNKFQLEDVIS